MTIKSVYLETDKQRLTQEEENKHKFIQYAKKMRLQQESEDSDTNIADDPDH